MTPSNAPLTPPAVDEGVEEGVSDGGSIPESTPEAVDSCDLNPLLFDCRPVVDPCDLNPLLVECQPVVDPCEVNPLLVECQPELAEIPPESVSSDDPDRDFLIRRAETILSVNCGLCHGSQILNSEDADAGINFIDDMKKLVDAGWAIAGDSENSTIIQLMRNGSMPPISVDFLRPSDREIDQVAEFLDNPVFN